MTETERGDRVAGYALIGASLLSMFTMAHHPTSMAAGALIGVVHGVMILLVGVMTYGFTHYAGRRGLGRPLVLAGLVAFAIGAAAGIGAGTINGFIAPAVRLHEPVVSQDLFVLAWEANQALAKLGVIATGAAYLLWSLDLWRDRRLAAAFGIVTGGIPALLLIGGWLNMHLHAAILVYGTQALWAILIGWLLLRGRLTREGSAD